MQIPTKGGAVIGPIRPIGAAARIAGAVGPGIDGPAMEAAALGDADDGRRPQMGEGELNMRLSSDVEKSFARMPATHQECGSSLAGGAAVDEDPPCRSMVRR